MSVSLGKRKRPAVEQAAKKRESAKASSDPGEDDDAAMQDIFRKHFEAKFKPLPAIQKPKEPEVPSKDNLSESEEDWSGFSEEEDEVLVVEHSEANTARDITEKFEAKAFLVRDARKT
jgi:hypothetical protein